MGEEAIILNVDGPQRSLFGKLVKIVLVLLVVAGVIAVVKAVKGGGGRKQMTESQVRERFEKVASKLGEERADALADKVVDKMRSKGVLVEEDAAESEEAAEEDAAEATAAATDEEPESTES